MSYENCSSGHYKEIPSKYYCLNCKIYLCEECERYHSKIFHNHKICYSKENVAKIFDGFCKENNHLEKLEFFCKTHNKLCCSSCITKIKRKGKGQHTDCDICLIEDIKDTKKDLLNKNYSILKELSKNISGSIKELKYILETLNNNKYELKLKIKTTFNEIKKLINEKENELIKEVDETYEKIYISNNKIKQIYSTPNEIKQSLEKSNLNEYYWENDNKLMSLINESLNIENIIFNINKNNEIMQKIKNDFNPIKNFYKTEDNYINNLHKNFISFGKDNKINISNDKNKEKIQKNLDIKINSLYFIKNNVGFTFNFLTFNSEQYFKYYSRDMKYEDNENLVFTLCLEGNDENSINSIINIINDFILENNKISVQKSGKNLFIDCKTDSNFDDGILKDIFNETISNSITIKSSMKFSEILKMKFDEFYNYLCSFLIEIKINKTTINKLKSIFEKLLKEVIKQKQKENEESEEEEKSNKTESRGILWALEKFFSALSYFSELIYIDSLKGLIYLITLLDIPEKINIDISNKNLFKFIKCVFEDEKLNEIFIDIKEKILRTFIKKFIKGKIKEILDNINLDKIYVSILFSKIKSGFVFDIKTEKLNDAINSFFEDNNNADEYEENEEKLIIA